MPFAAKYLTGAGGNGNIGDGIKATGNVDFAAHYRLDDHFKLALEGIDLTDQPITQFTDARANRLEAMTRSGATYAIGLSYGY